jgi:hypothetical protein
MKKVHGRPFEPGNKLGRGRPQGILWEFALPLMRKCIGAALQGDMRAMRMCMARISPEHREALIRMMLPKIKDLQDVDKAAEKVTRAVQRGGITPAEGGKLMDILEARARIMGKAPRDV